MANTPRVISASSIPSDGPVYNPERGTVRVEVSGRNAGQVSTEDELLLQTARTRFQTSAQAESRLRQHQLTDLRFRASEQWPANIKADREQDGRPCLTINRLPVFIRQVTNQQRQSKPSVQINPVDSGSDPETAEVLQGIIRHIEINSNADVAYDTACDHQVTIGRGYIRIIIDWSDDNPWEQEIKIRRVRNPFLVYFDPTCSETDYRDARYAFVIEDLPKDEFKAQYGDTAATNTTLLGSMGDSAPDWMPEGKIRVAEYFWVETTPESMTLLSDGREMPTSAARDEQVQIMLAASGVREIRTRVIERRQVKWAKITGNQVLERRDWPGKWIPIVPVLGDEIDINGEVDLRGMVRDAKDPQRMYNYWVDLDVDTPIPTPSGWSTMGALRVGDQVLDNKGKPCNVIGKSPLYVGQECYRVMFDDGTSIVASHEHRWTVEERGGRKDPTWEWTTKTVTTRELTPGKHFIWATKPLALDEAPLPIEPYTLGVWLSDGTSASGQIHQKTSDIEHLRVAMTARGECPTEVVTSAGDMGRFTCDGLSAKLRSAGLLGNKHIPAVYLRASLPQRLALLQGLMDGDGSIARRNRVCEFSTGSDVIRDGVRELLHTLGIKGKWLTRKPRTSVFRSGQKAGRCVVGSRPVHQCSFTAPPPEAMPVFAVPRKFAGQRAKNGKYHPRRTDRWRITAVDPVASTPTQCIGVDSPDHLYLAGPSMIPTHNSAETEAIALAPRTPFIGAEGQFEGHEAKWKAANRRNFPYLEYKPKTLGNVMAPPPQRNVVEPPIMAIVAATRQSDNDLKAVTGFYDASLGSPGPEQSGKAIVARQRQGDIANINWLDNLGRSIKAVGRIVLDLIPKIYDAPRVMRILGLDDQPKMVMVHAGQPPDQQAAEETKGLKGVYDLSVGRYDVTVSVGPSHQSRRQEAVQAMMEFVQAFPPAAPAIGDVLAENMDWPGAQIIARRLKKMVPPQLQDEQPGGANVPPEIQQQMAQMQQQIQQMQHMLEQASGIIKGKQVEQQGALQAKQLEQAAQLERTQMETASRERIEAARIEAQITVAEIGAEGEAAKAAADAARAHTEHLLDIQSDLMKHASTQQHERVLTAAEAAQAERDRQHALLLDERARQASRDEETENGESE